MIKKNHAFSLRITCQTYFPIKKKQPMPEYEAAKEDGLSVRWVAHDGDYCLYVSEKRLQPPR